MYNSLLQSNSIVLLVINFISPESGCNVLILFWYCSDDHEGAVDTLQMAITLIKQSMTAGMESSQILI